MKPTAKRLEPKTYFFDDGEALFYCPDCLDEFDTYEEWEQHRENVEH